jgi:hypothetical protein
MIKKIKSVIELSKYKKGHKLYFLDLYTDSDKDLTQNELHWMTACHPKIFFAKKIYKYNTKSKYICPRLPSAIFSILSSLLVGRFDIISFEVSIIRRCANTGEFYYFDGLGDWHPESILFTTERKALNEKKRILSLVEDWSSSNRGD